MAKRMFGRVPEPLTVNAHNAAVFRATVGYEYFLAKAARVDARLKALAALRAATMVGCPF
jgi:alkylhydroperoxidase family enzyme